jgi:type III restriction enzyme
MKPAPRQFQIYYPAGTEHPEYQPDFVAETKDAIYMLEPKARNELHAADVQAKKAVAIAWCEHASEYAVSNDGKLWHYVLIPHDVIAENMTLKGLADQFVVRA